MRAVVQRVSRASVVVDCEQISSIGAGLLVLLGVEKGDDKKDAQLLCDKVAGLRIFADSAALMNLSVSDTGGSVLVVSQFTLLGDVRRGKRPSFISAASPDVANQLYEYFCDQLANASVDVKRGKFQADMQVELVNDGPVTILLESRKLF